MKEESKALQNSKGPSMDRSSYNCTVQQESAAALDAPINLDCLKPSPYEEDKEGRQDADNDFTQMVSYTMIEQALNEIKEFITILFGSCIRFYSTLMLH